RPPGARRRPDGRGTPRHRPVRPRPGLPRREPHRPLRRPGHARPDGRRGHRPVPGARQTGQRHRGRARHDRRPHGGADHRPRARRRRPRGGHRGGHRHRDAPGRQLPARPLRVEPPPRPRLGPRPPPAVARARPVRPLRPVPGPVPSHAGHREAGEHPKTTAPRATYTPDTLLSVAVQVFNERGYDGTSMEHLSKAAGISKSSIYHHVAGKEELLRRAVSRALDGLFGILDEEPAREGRAADRLEYVVRRMVEVLTAELPYVTLLLRVRGNTGTERWALERRREFDHPVAALLRAEAADGDGREDIDRRLVTRRVFGMINSIVEWYRPDGRGSSEREVADAVVRLAFDGLRKAP